MNKIIAITILLPLITNSESMSHNNQQEGTNYKAHCDRNQITCENNEKKIISLEKTLINLNKKVDNLSIIIAIMTIANLLLMTEFLKCCGIKF